MAANALGNRNIGLDYLRSMAILIVLANHALLGFFIDTGKVKFEGITAALSVSSVIAIEWLFVLSGFLIGTMMIRSFERQSNWLRSARDFWLRRWFRTVPNYYLFVFVNLFLVYVGYSNGKFEYKYFAFSQNLAWVEATPHFFGESWSLALDEWFYLTMPILIGCLSFFVKDKKVSFIGAACILITLPMVDRIFHITPDEFFQWDAEIRRITIYHLDATGWGVLAASANKWFPGWWHKDVKNKAAFGILSMGIGLFLVIGLINPSWDQFHLYHYSSSFSITFLAGGSFLVLPWLASWRIRKLNINWVVEKLSLYSYSIYLVHFPLIFIFRHFIELNKESTFYSLVLVTFCWLTLIIFLSAIIFHWFEKPVSDLRESFTKRVDASPF